MKKALLFGIGASFFFSFTFVLNRQMNIGGGSWYWSSSLRYIFMLPILFFIVTAKKQLFPVIEDIKKNPAAWFIWSTVHTDYGFGDALNLIRSIDTLVIKAFLSRTNRIESQG